MTNHEAIAIRPATDSDMDAVTAIYAHHVLYGVASFETTPPDAAEMRRRRADVLARGLPYFVAADGDAVLGYTYASPYRTRAAYANSVENSVYLHPDAIGRGLGTRLLTVLIETCESLELRQIVAIVGDSANIASIRLHEKLGFRRVGVLQSVGYKHGRWLDSVLLQRSLGKGAATPPAR